GPDVGGAILPGARDERPPGDRGLPRREVRQAADAHARVHRHHQKGGARRASRPRRDVLSHEAVPAPVHALSTRSADLHRSPQPAEPVPDEMVDAVTIVGTPKQCRDQMQKYFDTGVHEIRLVFNEPNKDAYLKALRAVAPRG